jgi:outer membrane protein OmpA-like peptidoglycan-associated protein
MRKLIAILPGIILFLGLCSACATKNTHTVILASDPDGHVGKAEVTTAGGKQLLDTANAMTTISGPDAAPARITTAPSEYMNAKFAPVLAVEPAPSVKFIIYFHNNTSEMTSESRAIFPQIIDAINKRQAISIKISGHADSTGSDILNNKLSYARARSIKELLVKHGINTENMEVSSHGKGNQLIPTADNVAEPRNRRVEIIVR